MDRAIPEFLLREDLCCAACRQCGHKAGCPRFCSRAAVALRRSADRGSASARRLAEEARRFYTAVSGADDIRGLLEESEAVEQKLNEALHTETSDFSSLFDSVP